MSDMNCGTAMTRLALAVSTGVDFRRPAHETVSRILACGCQRIELAALRDSELEAAYQAYATLRQGQHQASELLSFHAPDRFSGTFGNLYRDIKARTGGSTPIVVHPHILARALYETHEGPDQFDMPDLLLENLDNRRIAWQFTHRGELLRKLLDELPQTGVCLDVAHALSVEPNPKLLREELAAIAHRVREIHLSFFDSSAKHAPLDEQHHWWLPAQEIVAWIADQARETIPVVLETPATSEPLIQEQIRLAQRLIE